MGAGPFDGQAEGIALWKTGSKSGYWIATDEGMRINRYHVFDRETLEHLGTLAGEVTLYTDGIWLDSRPLGGRFRRAFFMPCRTTAMSQPLRGMKWWRRRLKAE